MQLPAAETGGLRLLVFTLIQTGWLMSSQGRQPYYTCVETVVEGGGVSVYDGENSSEKAFKNFMKKFYENHE